MTAEQFNGCYEKGISLKPSTILAAGDDNGIDFAFYYFLHKLICTFWMRNISCLIVNFNPQCRTYIKSTKASLQLNKKIK
jgi:hypothetical protein